MTKSEKIALYRYLKLPRLIEEKMLLQLRKGNISKWFSGIGQEAISVGTTYALNSDDMILPMHRNLGVFTTREFDYKRLFCQLMGKNGGYTKGRDRTFHFGYKEKSVIGMISHLAAMLPVANGIALSYQLKKENKVAVAFIGDGATSEGDFHEALNLAAVWKLPVIFIIENNGYGLSTPTKDQYNCNKLSDKAIGYGMKGIQIDGNDIEAVISTIQSASTKARSGKGPTLIEAMTFRMRGHEEASGTTYIPDDLFKEWAKKDPIKRYESKLIKQKILNSKLIKEIENEIMSLINPALNFSLSSDIPKSDIDSELKDVFHPIIQDEKKDTGKSNNIRFVDAIKESLYQNLENDNSVILMGQDIAEYGGVFKTSEGFVEKFGKDRIRNTPIIESGIIGAAMGLALEGFKPVVEMQFADFITCGFNQTVNNLAKTHYRWGEPINVTLRMPCGGTIGAGPFHSQSPEAWFFHVPGLKIVYPSNPRDAKALLNSSIQDPNPVLYFEHKALYRSMTEMVPENLEYIPIGIANVVKEGSDLSVITYGIGVKWAMEFSSKMKNEFNIEIIDLRSLIPWDKETVLRSVQKTNRAIVLHEANLTGGIGGEISSYLSEYAFEHLDAPIMRLASLDIPIPFSPELEDKLYLPVNRIEDTINQLMAY